MSFKKLVMLVGLIAVLLLPVAISANEKVSVNYPKKDIVVQNTYRYYPLKPVLDKLAVKSKVERTGDSVKLVLTEGSKTYQIILDEKESVALTPKGKFSYVVNTNNKIAFAGNFYSTILKDTTPSWNAKTNSLVLYEKKPKGLLLNNLEGYNAQTEVKKEVVAIKSSPTTPNSTYIPYETGDATWYGAALHGNLTASGERFDMNALTAAHKTLPFGTMVRVTNLNNKTSIVVKITDRGPFAPGRIIDLSQAAAEKIDMLSAGVVPVQLEILKTA